MLFDQLELLHLPRRDHRQFFGADHGDESRHLEHGETVPAVSADLSRLHDSITIRNDPCSADLADRRSLR